MKQVGARGLMWTGYGAGGVSGVFLRELPLPPFFAGVDDGKTAAGGGECWGQSVGKGEVRAKNRQESK